MILAKHISIPHIITTVCQSALATFIKIYYTLVVNFSGGLIMRSDEARKQDFLQRSYAKRKREQDNIATLRKRIFAYFIPGCGGNPDQKALLDSSVQVTQINLNQSPLKNNQIPKNAIMVHNDEAVQNLQEKALCIEFTDTGACVYANKSKIFCKTNDKESIDAMVQTAKAMGWKVARLIEIGQPGAIFGEESGEDLRQYALDAFAGVGIQAVDPSAKNIQSKTNDIEKQPTRPAIPTR
jgi:hypothetical protein